MEAETVLILLFIVASAVAIGVRRLQMPYTVALVLAGLLLGFTHAINVPHLTKEILFSIFLPGLLFEAAFHIEFTQFWRNKTTIVSLAVPGLAAAIALTVLILTPATEALHFAAGFNWRHALVFGALISATDPIAVVGIFKSLGVPKRLGVLLDGESLLNDGTAVVFFTLSLSLVAGAAVHVGGLALDFVSIVGFGGLIGTAIGLAVSQVIRNVDDPMIETTLTTIAAYGSFVAAEHFQFSGVIATVCAGMLCGNYATRVGMSPSTRVAVETFGEYVAFALNSIVFLLIGFEVHLQTLFASWKVILLAYLAVIVGRGLVIFAAHVLFRSSRERIPLSWSVVLTWGGLRGGLPMVLVLSLAPDFPYRDLLVTMTFGVVLLSILAQGLTMSPLLRRLGIVERSEERDAYELARGRLQATNAALSELNEMEHVHFQNRRVLSVLRGEYEGIAQTAREEIEALHVDRELVETEELKWARRHLLLTEKNRVIDAFHQGLLGQDIYERLLADIDARLLRLESGETREPE
ncbi:MAG: Na+/H+ antiporter [Acidobacteriota bacterium]